MSALPSKRFRVTLFEVISHEAIIEAPTDAAAEAEARLLWHDDPANREFHFNVDYGIDRIEVEEITA